MTKIHIGPISLISPIGPISLISPISPISLISPISPISHISRRLYSKIDQPISDWQNKKPPLQKGVWGIGNTKGGGYHR